LTAAAATATRWRHAARARAPPDSRAARFLTDPPALEVRPCRQHYKATGYPLCVKLGTITAEGEADVFSYAEDDLVIDPHLTKVRVRTEHAVVQATLPYPSIRVRRYRACHASQHLEHFGINVKAMQKTDKTMAEMEIDQNLTYEFSRLQESGKTLQPLHGPGYTGLQNLGNTCYMASVVQVLFSLPPFIEAYFENGPRILENAPKDPDADLTVQLAKMATGLLSGRYSSPYGSRAGLGGSGQGAVRRADRDGPPHRLAERLPREAPATGVDGIPPRSLKALVGKGHPEFSTMRQQDGALWRQWGWGVARAGTSPSHPPAVPSTALYVPPAVEFFQYLMTAIERNERASGRAARDPSAAFKFRVESRVQCGVTGKVAYHQHVDSLLPLTIPLERATNLAEVAAYEVRHQGAAPWCVTPSALSVGPGAPWPVPIPGREARGGGRGRQVGRRQGAPDRPAGGVFRDVRRGRDGARLFLDRHRPARYAARGGQPPARARCLSIDVVDARGGRRQAPRPRRRGWPRSRRTCSCRFAALA